MCLLRTFYGCWSSAPPVSVGSPFELDTDHTPHLSMTAALDDALQQFARHAADAR